MGIVMWLLLSISVACLLMFGVFNAFLNLWAESGLPFIPCAECAVNFIAVGLRDISHRLLWWTDEVSSSEQGLISG